MEGITLEHSTQATISVNLGCGDHKAEGWVNIDIAPEVEPDIVASILDLPFEDNSIDRVYVGHVLEHIPLLSIVDAAHEVYRVLKPGGVACFVGPDFFEGWKNSFDEETLNGIVYGADRWGTTDIHLWVCTEEPVLIAASEAGFHIGQEVTLENIEEGGWPIASLIGWQFGFLASK